MFLSVCIVYHQETRLPFLKSISPFLASPPLPQTCRLHHSINTMGCTGGGAYKFSDLFQDRLAITLRKMDELDCLMRGLEFVLQHVVGECYTYKPDKSLATVTGSGLDRMPWRSSSGAAVSPTPPTSFSSAAQGEIPPLPKGKVSRVGVGGLAYSSSTPAVGFAASACGGGNSHPHIGSSSGAFEPKTDNNSLGLSLDGESGTAEEDGGLSELEGSPRLRASSAYSSTGMPSPPSNGAEAPEEPRRRAHVSLYIYLICDVSMIGKTKSQTYHPLSFLLHHRAGAAVQMPAR